MNLAQLKKRLAELKADGQKIVDTAEAAGGDFTAEQENAFAAIEDEITAVQADIAAAEKLAERRRAMTALPAGRVASPAGTNTVRDANPALTGGFADIGEFAASVFGAVQAGRMGGTVDDRLSALSNSHEGGGSSGEGYSLPPQFRDDVWELVNSFDELGPLIDEEPTMAREVKLRADETTPWGTSGIKANWKAEGVQMTPSQLADEGRNVPLHELYVLALASEELLEDAPRMANRLTRKAAEAIAWKKNLAIVDGTGTGQPLGWMRSGALVTVAKESGQSADTIVALNVINMFSRLQMIPGDKPFWMVNQDTLPQLMTMTVGDQPIWMPPNGLANAPGGFLLGRPVRFSEFADTLGDKGDIQLVSPKGYYGARRSTGPKFASSIHLYFDYNTQAFRWVFRYGGQPHLSAPITPKNGSATKSHFVTLAERA
jgi:HK97 family phage major capsid protein